MNVYGTAPCKFIGAAVHSPLCPRHNMVAYEGRPMKAKWAGMSPVRTFHLRTPSAP